MAEVYCIVGDVLIVGFLIIAALLTIPMIVIVVQDIIGWIGDCFD